MARIVTGLAAAAGPGSGLAVCVTGDHSTPVDYGDHRREFEFLQLLGESLNFYSFSARV